MTDRDSDSVFVIDLSDWTVPNEVHVGHHPRGILANPNSGQIFVANRDSYTFTVIDADSLHKIGPDISGNYQPTGVVFNSTSGRLYTTNPGPNTVTVIDTNIGTSSPIATPGGTITVTWRSFYGTSGADRVGIFAHNADDATPIAPTAQKFTNGTSSAGGNGVPSGSVTLQIPANQALGPYQVRLISAVNGGSALAGIDLYVTSAPAVAADSYSANYGGSFTKTAAEGVLANDSNADPQFTSLRAEVVTPPAHGSLSLLPTGAFTYVPATTFAGTDTFTYRAINQLGLSLTGTVSLTINAVSCGPRPTVSVSTAIVGGALQATLTASNTNAPNNAISRIQFGTLDPTANATVTLNGNVVTSGQTITLPANTTTQTFTVRRITAGQPTTVRFTATDTCGSWPTFVGGGPSAGF